MEIRSYIQLMQTSYGFFLKKLGWIKQLLNTISFLFSLFADLKPNISKCEVTQIRLLKGVKVAVCKIKCIDLTKDAIKILGIFFHVIKILVKYRTEFQIQN